jgi:carboxylesterase type B
MLTQNKGFTGGNGISANAQGDNFASREDIVTVEIQYRLSTLGFLAVPGTNVTGNYGIQDQNLALKVRKSYSKPPLSSC